MGEHRVTISGGSLRRYEDPARSSNPRIRELVGALATLEPAPALEPHFRADLRAQLVAVAPRLVAEGEYTDTAPPVRPAAVRSRRGVLATLAAVPLRRPLTVIGGVLTVFAMVLGGAVYLSQRALPGDALYGLKRASESVQLSLTTGDAAKGRRYLALATTRADEVSELLSHPSAAGPGLTADGISPHTASQVKSTLGSADSDLRTAAQLLGAQAVREGSKAPLMALTAWAPGQLVRMQTISAALPAGALRTRAESSSILVLSALNRASALTQLSGCTCLSRAPSDALGPVPCSVCSSTPAGSATPGVPAATAAGVGTAKPAPNHPAGKTATPTLGSSAAGTGSTGGAGHSTGSGQPTRPGISVLPTGHGLTLPTASLPLTVTVSLPPLVPGTPAASGSSTCSIPLQVIVPGLLELNLCTGVYIKIG